MGKLLMNPTPNYAALFDASPYPYLLVGLDWNIIGANKSYLNAVGRTLQDILGLPLFEAFPPNPQDPTQPMTTLFAHPYSGPSIRVNPTPRHSSATRCRIKPRPAWCSSHCIGVRCIPRCSTATGNLNLSFKTRSTSPPSIHLTTAQRPHNCKNNRKRLFLITRKPRPIRR